MAKKKNKKSKVVKNNIVELNEKRIGGQVALRGYSYQFLYSCYLVLSTVDDDTTFILEGVEDIDSIKLEEEKESAIHIQLKYSTIKQDASFMKSVLKNFLEAYLIDTNRCFKLVYDFQFSTGNLSKLFDTNLDASSKKYWQNIISDIKNSTPLWNWNNYNFDDFFAKLSFEKVQKDSLAKKIEEILIHNYDITTDNIDLYANSLKLLCLDRMENKGELSKKDVIKCIESVKFEISKGVQNPAHSWIQQLSFSKSLDYSSDYFEGKKATPADIANNLPIERPVLEKEVIESIHNNVITIIKTSSGQGKTTLALRAMLSLKDEYTPYQIVCCNNDTELVRIAEYFRMRTRLGEKPLILLDNLDSHLNQWNALMQIMQTTVTYHYKILVTSRENDWYNYSGDISNLQSLHIIKPILTNSEAEAIFYSLKKANKLHDKIKDWKKPWAKIAERQLLIEYVYLLTHGEMISERISAQMKEIGTSSAGSTKFEILRKVCFADVCGIRLETKSLIKSLTSKTDIDIGELLKSMSNEFLVHVSANGSFIEGLHPVRSQHIVERLHEYVPLDETAIAIAKIVDRNDISVLFSQLSNFDLNKEVLYTSIVDAWCNTSNLSRLVLTLRGVFSGSVMKYFYQNRDTFNDAHERGGLYLLATDICPFSKFEEYDKGMDTLDKIKELQPDNSNIEYLIMLRNSLPIFKTDDTDIYCFSSLLFQKIKNIRFEDVSDIESYASIVEWLYNIDTSLNLATNISLKFLWDNIEKCSVETISSLMYSCFYGNKAEYLEFTQNNISRILTCLKQKTHSHTISINDDKKAIKVEYILKASEKTKGNSESVDRLQTICRMLPIYELYCADAITPQIDILSSYQTPDDAHKAMPIENLIITFRQEINALWINTIQSNYEFDTISQWVEYWLNVRQCACDLMKASCQCLYKILSANNTGNAGRLFEDKYISYNRLVTAPLLYPREHRPFEKSPEIPMAFQKIKSEYFNSIQNFSNQLVSFIKHDEQAKRLVPFNIIKAQAALAKMYKFFNEIVSDETHLTKHKDLCTNELKQITEIYMVCRYFIEHEPNRSFNKYQVKTWFLLTKENAVSKVKTDLINLKDLFNAEFPEKTYIYDIFNCYPIILRNFNPTEENDMQELIIASLHFSESVFDYLEILCCNDKGELYPNAIRFPKRIFSKFQENLDTGKDEELDVFSSPYPIEVSKDMLDCFNCETKMQKTNEHDSQLGYVGLVGEELWVYSKTRDLLTDIKDYQYCEQLLKDIKKSISEKITLIRKAFSGKVADDLFKYCKKIYDGDCFGDNELNQFFHKVEAYSSQIERVS